MEINDLRSITTVISLVMFLVVVAWAWSGRNRAAFDEAAALPFRDEASSDSSPQGGRNE